MFDRDAIIGILLRGYFIVLGLSFVNEIFIAPINF